VSMAVTIVPFFMIVSKRMSQLPGFPREGSVQCFSMRMRAELNDAAWHRILHACCAILR
jgi:hypothetical protein